MRETEKAVQEALNVVVESVRRRDVQALVDAIRADRDAELREMVAPMTMTPAIEHMMREALRRSTDPGSLAVAVAELDATRAALASRDAAIAELKALANSYLMGHFGHRADCASLYGSVLVHSGGVESSPARPCSCRYEQLAAALRTPKADAPRESAPRDPNRCPVCDWPLAANIEGGCVPGNCSYRPRPGTDEYRRIKARREELARAAQDSGEKP